MGIGGNSVTGPSPLARGTHRAEHQRPGRPGTIPARAGNTSPRPTRPSPPGDHPRSRGEHDGCLRAVTCLTGPSPLARGTLDPAGVVQPSRCGPSPLARGTPHRAREIRRRGGTIPARAGNTSALSPRTAPPRDHPRSRGEHRRPWQAVLRTIGPSPLARGTQHDAQVHHPRTGTIPARAGNTPHRRFMGSSPWDHPRSRGEHRSLWRAVIDVGGPSPLARGTHHPQGQRPPLPRTIPARAGNTSGPTARPRPPGDHPRSRGEHINIDFAANVGKGPSPLARGTRRVRRDGRGDGGTIPARAGNTGP